MRRYLKLFTLVVLLSSFIWGRKEKPTLYIIGDSTVRNGDGTGKNGQWGWGNFIASYLDTTRITVKNLAIGGRSSRTFINEGRWESIVKDLKKGDYVLMQFGHNDASPLDDTARARGTIKGTGEEAKEIYNPITKKQEVVHTYGWYMRKYVREAKEKGAIPIVASLIPRDNWKDGKIVRSPESYAGWAQEVAKEEGAYFIDLNNVIAEKYDQMGVDAVHKFFPYDHTHTNKAGAELNARIVVNELKKIKPKKMAKYFKK